MTPECKPFDRKNERIKRIVEKNKFRDLPKQEVKRRNKQKGQKGRNK